MEQQCGQAAGGAGGQGSLMGMLFPLALFVVIFYFFIIKYLYFIIYLILNII